MPSPDEDFLPTYTETPYQGDPDFYEPYVPYQSDPYTEPYIPEPDYEPVDKSFIDNPDREDVGPPRGLRKNPEELPEEFDKYLRPQPQPEPQPEPVLPWEPAPYVPEPYVPEPDPNFYEPGYGNIGEPDFYDGGGGGSLGDRMIDAESDDGFGYEDYYNYMGMARGGLTQRYALGGLGSLGGYSDGGRLLKGPGDGVSDSIPATIGNKKQPARLADGEFVVPARIVSELGNGSTEAGARKLYAMMDRIQKARGKTVGKGKVAANSRSEKHLPA